MNRVSVSFFLSVERRRPKRRTVRQHRRRRRRVTIALHTQATRVRRATRATTTRAISTLPAVGEVNGEASKVTTRLSNRIHSSELKALRCRKETAESSSLRIIVVYFWAGTWERLAMSNTNTRLEFHAVHLHYYFFFLMWLGFFIIFALILFFSLPVWSYHFNWKCRNDFQSFTTIQLQRLPGPIHIIAAFNLVPFKQMNRLKVSDVKRVTLVANQSGVAFKMILDLLSNRFGASRGATETSVR